MSDKINQRNFTPQIAWRIIANNLNRGYLSLHKVKKTNIMAENKRGCSDEKDNLVIDCDFIYRVRI